MKNTPEVTNPSPSSSTSVYRAYTKAAMALLASTVGTFFLIRATSWLSSWTSSTKESAADASAKGKDADTKTTPTADFFETTTQSSVPYFTEKRAFMQTPSPTPATHFFPSPFNLNALNTTDGFTIDGSSILGGSFGSSISSGKMDRPFIMIGSPSASTPSAYSGMVHVIFVPAGGWPTLFSVASNSSDILEIPGIALNDQLGTTVLAKDINGDGYDDLLMGAPGADLLYVVFGHPAPWPAQLDLTTVTAPNSTAGMIISGGLGASNNFAQAIAVADINNDGKQDLIVGSPNASPGGLSQAGIVYVLFQPLSNWTARLNASALTGPNGFTILGTNASTNLGTSIIVKDIDGDLLPDIIMGAPASSSTTAPGAVYVVFNHPGSWSAQIPLLNLNSTTGIRIAGILARGQFGYAIATGDLNNDGRLDVVVGAPAVNGYNGAVYTILSTANGWSASVNVSTLNGTNGFTSYGTLSSGKLGNTLTTLKLNGDMIDDLIMGALEAFAPSPYAGVVYAAWGNNGSWPAAQFNLSNLNNSNIDGFVSYGIANEYLGTTVSNIIDINNDGNPDLGVATGTSKVIVLYGFGAGAAASTPSPASTPTPASAPAPASTPFPAPQPSASPQPSSPSCPSNQPLTWLFHNLKISKGTAVRVSPSDISVGCGTDNQNQPIDQAFFIVTGIRAATVERRDTTTSLWNSTLSFWGHDLAQANVEIIQDGSDTATALNLTATYGIDTLANTEVTVEFYTNQSTPQVETVTIHFQPNGAVTLNSTQFQITDTNHNIDDLVITVDSTLNGYFANTENTTIPITEFSYYQLKTGNIQFVHNGTLTPNITLSVDNGSGKKVTFHPSVQAFNLNNGTSSVPLGIILGSIGGILVLAGVGAFALWKTDEQHRIKRRKAASNVYENTKPKEKKAFDPEKAAKALDEIRQREQARVEDRANQQASFLNPT